MILVIFHWGKATTSLEDAIFCAEEKLCRAFMCRYYKKKKFALNATPILEDIIQFTLFFFW